MATVIDILVVSVMFAMSVHAAPTETTCVCDPEPNPSELDGLFNFLDDVEKETKNNEVIPGFLSPMVPCPNCLDYSRKKRRIFETFTEKPIDFVTESYGDIPVGVHKTQAKDIVRLRAEDRCAGGYVKIGPLCVEDYDE